MMLALDEVIDIALADEPLYFDLLTYKVDGLQNFLIMEVTNKRKRG